MKEKYMLIALKEANKAALKGDVPVGAVIVKNDKVIAKGHNTKNVSRIATRHAEIIAIERASKKLGDWRLNDCQLYVTLEPCQMCLGAIKESRINTVYIGTRTELCTKVDVKIEYGILENECSCKIRGFFKEIR